MGGCILQGYYPIYKYGERIPKGSTNTELTFGHPEWFMDESSKGFGFFGALASGLVRPNGRWKRGAGRSGPFDMEHEADQPRATNRADKTIDSVL
jgi:hypothetical protein